jgi:hypothetical protein
MMGAFKETLSSKLDHIYYTLLCIYMHSAEQQVRSYLLHTFIHIYMHTAEQQVRSYLLHTFMQIYICTLLSSKLDHIYYTLLCIYICIVLLLRLLPARGNKACNYAEPKPISWAEPAQVGFSSSNFSVQDHITKHSLEMVFRPHPTNVVNKLIFAPCGWGWSFK